MSGPGPRRLVTFTSRVDYGNAPRPPVPCAMLMHALVAALHPLVTILSCVPSPGVSCVPNQSADHLSKPVLDTIAGPLLTSAQFLIPAAVALSGIHKMMEHRESGGSFLVDMVTKGGGAVLVLALIKSIAGVG